MLTLTLVMSRLVPLLLVCSALLVVGRILYDRIASRSLLVARWVIVGLVVASTAALSPWVHRSGLMIAARVEVQNGNWKSAGRAFAEYALAGGHLTMDTRYYWAKALMNQRRWREAEKLLLGGMEKRADRRVNTHPEIVLALGICRYYLGNRRAAEIVFNSFPPEHRSIETEYFLGRIRESQAPEQALDHYQRCLTSRPCFFPALYCGLRLALNLGRRDVGARLIAGCTARLPASEWEQLDLRRFMSAASGENVSLPAKEFYLVIP